MKKTFIYSLVVAAFLVGCGDKDGASITEGVKNVAAGATEKAKEVAGDAASSAVDAVKEGRDVAGAAKEAVANAASGAVDTAKDVASAAVEKAGDAAGAAGDAVKSAGAAVVEKAGEAASGAVEAVKDAGSAAAEVAEDAKDAVVGAATAGDSIAGVSAYTKCKACHGANAEKKALGTSKIIAGWDAAETVKALTGYKDGSYGGAMKGVMKGQAATMSDADIANVAAYIATLK